LNNKFNNLIKGIKGKSYFDIHLYNDLYQSKKTGKLNITTGIDSLISMYDELFSFGFSLSGYQFIGLVLEKTIVSNNNNFAPLAYFLLSIGFLFSLFGAMTSFFIMEYLYSIKQESLEFIVYSLSRYKTLFKGFSDVLLYLDCILFLAPIIILIYNVLSPVYGKIFNICSGLLFILGLLFSYIVIIAKQIFKNSEENKEVKRLIYDKEN